MWKKAQTGENEEEEHPHPTVPGVTISKKSTLEDGAVIIGE